MKKLTDYITDLFPLSLKMFIVESRLLFRFKNFGILSGAKSPQNHYVTYVCDAGMANRLKAHLVATVLAKRSKSILALYWPKNKVCGVDFRDLFFWDGVPIQKFKDPFMIRFPGIFAPSDKLLSALPTSKSLIFDLGWQWITRDQFWDFIGNDADFARASLKPLPEIELQITDLSSKWPSKICGVHVRRGDFKSFGWTIDTERYIKKMKDVQSESGSDISFFLCSDGTTEELQPIIEAFPGKIYRRDSSNRNTTSGMKSALIDLLLLSRTSILILTPLSSFGELAAFLGNQPYRYA